MKDPEAIAEAIGDEIRDVIETAFVSWNETDSAGEPANVVDGLFAIARALDEVAQAIYEQHSPLEKHR